MPLRGIEPRSTAHDKIGERGIEPRIAPPQGAVISP